MKCCVNGAEHEYDGDPKGSLLDFLRRDLGILSPKDGCAPEATCGCCVVRLDGKPVLSCVTPMRKADGGTVQTIEGLPQTVQDKIAAAFAASGGAQCGFCIPGIVMRAAALIERNPEPSPADIEHELRFHLCRCTGYKKIIESVQVAARAIRDDAEIEAPDQSGKVGTRLCKYGVRDLVLGRHRYTADLVEPGMLHGAVRLSDHPRARVTAIDVSSAAALPGVERVFLAGDVPGQRTVGLIVPDWPLMVAVTETANHVGAVIACVAATTRQIARQAAALIEVKYEVLDPVVDVHRALRPDAPAVHEGSNELAVSRVRLGDAEEALRGCAFVSRGSYVTQRVEHAYMEPEACLGRPEGRGVRVFSQSQGVYEDRRQIAQLLGLDPVEVRVTLVANGGAFGGKEDLSIQGHAALMALLLDKPVHLELTRAESLRVSVKRHPIQLDYELGCDRDGKLQALRARIIGDTGAHASVGMKVLERAAGHATGAYTVPAIDVVARTVYTNNIPCGAMRGFGANQAAFAMEGCVDDLCEQGGFDRWQFRWDNALTEGGATATGQVLASGVGVRATLEAVEDVFRSSRMAGIACGLKNTGIGNGMPDDGRAKIVVKSPTEIELHHGWTEMGQGVHTMAVQTVCEETGLPPEIMRVVVTTEAETSCGMTTASRATSLVGNSLRDACKELVADLRARPLAELVGREYRGEWVCDWTTKPGAANGGPQVTHYSYSYATQVVILDDDGRIARVVAAHDAGRVMNPTLFEGQIEGSVHMGLGYALTEDFPMANGQPEFTLLRKCGVLRAKDTPDIEVRAVEVADEFGAYGLKGVGEIGLVPTAGAVANALFQFDGQRRRTLPMQRT